MWVRSLIRLYREVRKVIEHYILLEISYTLDREFQYSAKPFACKRDYYLEPLWMDYKNS